MESTSKPLSGTVSDPLYPDSDGEKIGESDFHTNARNALRQALKNYFARRDDVYVAANMFWYWEHGNPAANRAPDVMVVKGVGKHSRFSFRSWEENARPCTIVEIASERTWREDVGAKHDLYAKLGVKEYFIFHPAAVFVGPIFQGFRLENGIYIPLVADAGGSLISAELGLRLVAEGTMLRVRDARTGRRVLTRGEQTERALKAEHRARRAEQRVGQSEQAIREVEKIAEQEKRRADELAAEVARLRA